MYRIVIPILQCYLLSPCQLLISIAAKIKTSKIRSLESSYLDVLEKCIILFTIRFNEIGGHTQNCKDNEYFHLGTSFQVLF